MRRYVLCLFRYGEDAASSALRKGDRQLTVIQFVLRTPVAVLGSEEERAYREKQTRHRQVQLLELTKAEAHKKLFEGKYDLSIPAALQALRFSMDVYGQNSIELVPSYLLLGEASIGLKQHDQAEDYLSLAKWAVLKADQEASQNKRVKGADNMIRSQLARNFGLLYGDKGRDDEALESLGLDIYYSSLSKGPESIAASGGYFNLGKVFQKKGETPKAAAVFERVLSIWRKHFLESSETLDEAHTAEAIQTLSHIHTFIQANTHLPTYPDSETEVEFVLAMVYAGAGREELAAEMGERCLEAGPSAPVTLEVQTFLKGLAGNGNGGGNGREDGRKGREREHESIGAQEVY
ncbi:Zinc finger MYND domain-containing protein 12 [Rhizophlyctis rosea]|uniref:Zinc finger MYND domain-containing protein 12 n=1 Tax=Rhizophlyctis rosea TaxID=64517 RepID=A0AAD5S5B3_9FUNG|nr:Zinc finger MYND domain-containing protein 12 [Rhizophlyctis rosea]